MKENKQKAISKIDLSASAFMVIVSKCNDNDKILFIKEKKKIMNLSWIWSKLEKIVRLGLPRENSYKKPSTNDILTF